MALTKMVTYLNRDQAHYCLNLLFTKMTGKGKLYGSTPPTFFLTCEFKYRETFTEIDDFFEIIHNHNNEIIMKSYNRTNGVPVDHRIKLKECEKKDKYLDLARKLKKLWNMQVTIIPIVIGTFGTVTKGLLKGLEDLEVGGRVETIQTPALLRTVRILRRVLETRGDLLSLRLQRKTIG